jgi:hypothetical protein
MPYQRVPKLNGLAIKTEIASESTRTTKTLARWTEMVNVEWKIGGPAKVPGLICALPRCSAVFAPQLKNKPNKQNVIRSLTSLMVIPV